MTLRRRTLALLAFTPFLAFLSPVVRAQQTGGVDFEVSDADGKAIPGAEITLSGPTMQGSQFRETDASGRATFRLLPPGRVLAQFEAKGYLAIQRDVIVGLGSQPVERVTLAKGELSETVKVTAQEPIDTTKTNTSYQYDRQFLSQSQVGSGSRSYLSIADNAPGIGHSGGDAGNAAIRGATLGENRYTVDGVDTTDPVTGTWGLLTNIDSVQQVELTTGGFEPEYGLATGGIINQVTKSGSNVLHLTADLRYFDNTMQAGSSHFDNHQLAVQRNFDFTLGGPIVKDKLWYFLSYTDNIDDERPAKANDTRKFLGHNNLAKLTWQVNKDHRVSFQYTADPATISADNAGQLVAKEASDFQKQGADFYAINYSGHLTKPWFMTAKLAFYKSTLNAYPLHDTGQHSELNAGSGYLYGNYNDAQYSTRVSNQLDLAWERVSTGKNWHDVKFGYQGQQNHFDSMDRQPGGAQDYYDSTALGPADPASLYREDVVISAGKVRTFQNVDSLFVQDAWHVTKDTTLSYGLRWDQSTLKRDDHSTVARMALVQPRLGLSHDLTGDGRNVLRVSVARFLHPGILTLANVVATRANQTDVYLSEDYYGVDIDGNGTVGGLAYYTSFGGPGGSVVKKGIRAMHNDEIALGYEHQIRRNQVFGVNLDYRKTRDIIEDQADANGIYVVQNLPGLRRDYRDVELQYAWNPKRTHFYANWTIGWAKGNVEYDQGVGSDYDFPELSDNRYGYLSTDRRHRIKVYGWTEMPHGVDLAWSWSYGTGAPFNRLYDASQAPYSHYGYHFIDPRGKHRLPATTTLDLEVRKHFYFGRVPDAKTAKDSNERKTLTLLGTITNLFDSGSITSVNEVDPDQDHNFPYTANDSSRAAEDGGPDGWGHATGYVTPRRYEVGLRFEF